MKKSGTVKGLNLLCAVLCAVLLALQFVPFWAEEDGQVSIGGYIWFPSDHKTLDSQLSAEIEGYAIGDVVPLAVLLIGYLLIAQTGAPESTCIAGAFAAFAVAVAVVTIYQRQRTKKKQIEFEIIAYNLNE